MNRQQRRREMRKQRARRDWNARLLKVHAACGGVLYNYILTGERVEQVALAALAGEPTGTALAQAIGEWQRRADEPDQVLSPLCLSCETQFGPGLEPPQGYAVALSVNHAAAISTGICRTCCERDHDELTRVLLGWQRKLFPDAYVAPSQWGCA